MTSSGAPFDNVLRNLRQLRNSPASWALFGIILAIHAVVTLCGGIELEPAWSWYQLFGLSRLGILSGYVWELFTYGFLHGGWLHAGLNSAFILLIGSRVEHMAGPSVMVKATLAGVLGGGVGHLFLAPGGSGAPLLVGMSGGCFALLLLLTTLSPQSRMMPIPVSGRSLGMALLVVELSLALVDPSLGIPGLSKVGKEIVGRGMANWFDIGHACHFGGGLAGWGIGRWLLRPRISLKRLRAERERREAVESKKAG